MVLHIRSDKVMNYLWKKHNVLTSKYCKETAQGVEKMDNFRKSFQNEISKHSNVGPSVIIKKKQKRFRSAFTTSQLTKLEEEFKKDPYVTNLRREHLANMLDLPEKAIKIWFQNRRMKEKRDISSDEQTSPTGHIKISIIDNLGNDISDAPGQQTRLKSSLVSKIVFSNEMDQNEPVSDKVKEKVANLFKSESLNSLPNLDHENSEAKIEPVSLQNVSNIDTLDVRKSFQDENVVLPHSDKNKDSTKQPIGHILPFCQDRTTEPTVSRKFTLDQQPQRTKTEEVNSELKAAEDQISQQQGGYYPIDLSRYYSTIPSMPVSWNRYNVLPVVPPMAQNVSVYPVQAGNSSSNNLSIAPKKCSCDCHTSNLETPVGYQHQPMFYTQYTPLPPLPPLSHFITPLPTFSNPQQRE